MKAIAVDYDPDGLIRLCECIRMLHPDASVECFRDPLMAFKYGVSNPVDALYTSVLLKRLDGLSLAKMLREDHPDLQVNLIADDDAYKGVGMMIGMNSYTLRPVTPDALASAEREVW